VQSLSYTFGFELTSSIVSAQIGSVFNLLLGLNSGKTKSMFHKRWFILAAICVFLAGAMIPRRPSGQVQTPRILCAWAAPRTNGRTRIDYFVSLIALAAQLLALRTGPAPRSGRFLDQNAQSRSHRCKSLVACSRASWSTPGSFASNVIHRRC
jgi:hypothetical protein